MPGYCWDTRFNTGAEDNDKETKAKNNKKYTDMKLKQRSITRKTI